MGDTAGIEDALWRLGRLMYERDPAMVDEFVPDATLVGSEPGEIVHGREAIRALLNGIHARAERFTWQWDSVETFAEGDIGWFFADGSLVLEGDARQKRQAYRLAGVLQRQGSLWRWRLFHGSEPRV